jgi:hypothetical protein
VGSPRSEVYGLEALLFFTYLQVVAEPMPPEKELNDMFQELMV